MATATAKKPSKKATEAHLQKHLAALDKGVKTTPPKVKPNPQAQARADKLTAALKELGNGKNQIAESLKAKKIRGITGDSEDCPIAKFVKKLFPKAKSFSVDSTSIEVSFEKSEFDFSIKCPGAIGRFIDDFDGEKYPDLVQT